MSHGSWVTVGEGAAAQSDRMVVSVEGIKAQHPYKNECLYVIFRCSSSGFGVVEKKNGMVCHRLEEIMT
jgi:hypothetical protein